MNGYLVSVFQICRRRPNRKAAIAWFVVVCSVIFTAIATPAAVLAQTCAEGALPGSPGRFALSVRLENDALGGRGQDQNYTGGTFVTVRSPNLESFTDDPCLPSTIGWLNRTFTWLQPENVDQRNMIFGVAHLAYTPSDRLRTDVIAADRPYASLLLFSLGYNGRNGAQLKATQLRVGWVGPVTQGERVQNWYWNDCARFRAW